MERNRSGAMHAVAFKGALTSATSYAALTVITDSIFASASTTGVFVPAGMRLVGVYLAGIGTSYLGRGRVNAASLLEVAYPSIRPIQLTLGSTASPPNFQYLIDRPLLFPNNDVIGIDAALRLGDGVSGTTIAYGLLFFLDNPSPVPRGAAFWLRGVARAAAVSAADVWSGITIVWDTTLPPGEYAAIGMDHNAVPTLAANAVQPIAGRFIFPGQSYRPGVMSATNPAYKAPDAFYQGDFGVLGTFSSYAPPSLEVICDTTAQAEHEVYLRVIKL